MKRISFITFVSFVAIILFSTCKFINDDETIIHRPDVKADNGCIVISGSYDTSDLEYVLVYRKDAEDQNAQPIRLGMILTSSFDAHNKTYTFFDKTAIVDKTYTYFCRLYQGKFGYYKTEQSKEIKVPSDYGLSSATYTSEDLLKCTIDSDEYLIYDETTRMLTFKSSSPKTKITRPAFANDAYENYTDYCLIVTNGSSTQSFLLSTSVSGDWNNNADKEWNLQTVLPENYLNTEIQVLGIIAQKRDLDAEDSDIICRYLWTNLASIDVYNKETPAQIYSENKFTVKLQSGVDGIDYSM